jgi:hypothetical protein
MTIPEISTKKKSKVCDVCMARMAGVRTGIAADPTAPRVPATGEARSQFALEQLLQTIGEEEVTPDDAGGAGGSRRGWTRDSSLDGSGGSGVTIGAVGGGSGSGSRVVISGTVPDAGVGGSGDGASYPTRHHRKGDGGPAGATAVGAAVPRASSTSALASMSSSSASSTSSSAAAAAARRAAPPRSGNVPLEALEEAATLGLEPVLNRGASVFKDLSARIHYSDDDGGSDSDGTTRTTKSAMVGKASSAANKKYTKKP